MTDHANSKKIGLWGLVFTIIGFVVGVSVFILPAELVGIAGPAVLLSYFMAGSMAAITCMATAQIGTLIPAEGGSYVAITKLVSPFVGFLAVWVILASIIMVNAFIGLGFADYFAYFFPTINKTVSAVGIIVVFGLINIVGSQLVVRVQSLMVVFLLIMLGVFILSGVPHFDSSNLTPFMPNGFDAVILAATIGYFSFSGFISLLEFGSEIGKPARNIPLGLTFSFLIMVAFYGGISLILSGVDAGVDYASAVTPVIEVSRLLLPGWVVTILVLSILAAAASTVNGLILGYSRDIFVMSKDNLFPKFLSIRSSRVGTPVYAIITFTALSICAVLMGSDILEYALLAVLGLLLQQAFTAVSLLRVPKVMKEQYDEAEFKLPGPLLYFAATALFLISMGFVTTNIIREPMFGIMIVGLLAAGGLYYFIKQKTTS